MKTEIAIIGAGIAGATLAAALGSRARVLLLEAESHPGYHSTGRSAAFWSESYGGPAIQPLTTASFAGLAPYLGPRSCLHIADAGGEAALDALAADFAGRSPDLVPVDRDALARRVPGLSPAYVRALEEPSCRDIDVARYHGDALATAKRTGARLLTDAGLIGAERAHGRWRLSTRAGDVEADVVVNAAGAWAGEVAGLCGASPIAITPYRRTVIQLQTDPPAPADLPLVIEANGTFYFKPEAGGRLWLSPHDETPDLAQDVAPDELDVAIAIDRFERAVDWRVVKRERAWAGLRSFSPDRVPVYGFDGRTDGFFWCAGQGGFGIQTGPAAAALSAALLLGAALPGWLSEVDPERYLPGRFG